MKKWHTALMEIESAKADLEGARRAIWERAEAQETEEDLFLSSAGIIFRRAGVALFLLFLMAVPLSVGERPPFLAEREQKIPVFVTKDERELLTSLRKSLSAGAIRFSEADFSQEEGAGRVPDSSGEPRSYASASGTVSLREAPVPRKDENPSEEGLGVDEVLALVQVGERALRGSAIQVVTE